MGAYRYMCVYIYKPGGVGAEIAELVSLGEDDETNGDITENREFMCLLQKTLSSLCERYLSPCLLLYLFNHYLTIPPHLQSIFLKP